MFFDQRTYSALFMKNTGRTNVFKIAFLILLLTVLLPWSPVCRAAVVFSTWEGVEVDKLGSIWLIKRFIAPGAVIKTFPKGTVIHEGVQFDTPFAQIARRMNQSSFESLVSHYSLQDQKLEMIGQLVHDIEINVWERKMFQKTGEMQLFFMQLLQREKVNQNIIQKAIEYFDRLYKGLPEKLERNFLP